MKLNIFVHEFEYSVGHSKAMIEVLKRIPDQQIEHLRVICYSADEPHEHFSHLGNRFEIHKVPLSFLKPFILKSLFFQIYTLLFFRRKAGSINISMGVCSFVGDIINVQFCHFLWQKKYFSAAKLSFFKRIYKKILFHYLVACEDYVYSKENIKFVFLSKFMEEEFTKRYQIPSHNRTTTYSSADLSRFKPNEKSREDNLKNLICSYPQLSSLEPRKPISLFAGAFERKGLPFLLENLPQDHQLIVIGKGEKGSQFPLLEQEHIFHVAFTKEIELFYQSCDLFIFPTLFEPFGLVIMEAAMCGMKVLVSKEHVGATEILEGLEGIDLINPLTPEHEWINHPTILSESERFSYYEKRKGLQNQLSWEKCCKDWLVTINLFGNENSTNDCSDDTN